jgi:hypothetical protein
MDARNKIVGWGSKGTFVAFRKCVPVWERRLSEEITDLHYGELPLSISVRFGVFHSWLLYTLNL